MNGLVCTENISIIVCKDCLYNYYIYIYKKEIKTLE